MKGRHLVVVILLFLSLEFSSSVQAHSPYFGQVERINHPKFGVVEFTVLYGDGIFFADPSRVVVIDSEGYLLAATSQSTALFIHCDSSTKLRSCQIYDELRGIVFEPHYEKWTRSRIIKEGGRPSRDAYPEYMNIRYGFTARSATVSEKFNFEVASVLSSPISSVLLVFWWMLAWSLIVRQVWKWKQNNWQLRPLKWSSIALGVFGFIMFIGMSFLVIYGWLVKPYSLYFFSFAFVLGALISAALTQPKAVVQKD